MAELKWMLYATTKYLRHCNVIWPIMLFPWSSTFPFFLPSFHFLPPPPLPLSSFPLHPRYFKLYRALYKIFFPSTTKLWNDISLDALPQFYWFFQTSFTFLINVLCLKLIVFIDGKNAIIHTRLRLDACPFNYYLFKIGCRESPVCSHKDR